MPDSECLGYFRTEAYCVPYTMSEIDYTPETAPTASGKFGTGATWRLERNGTLAITGTGAIPDYTAGSQPWAGYAGLIQAVTIDEGVTAIGAHAFDGLSGLAELTVPSTCAAIGSQAFANTSLSAITFTGDAPDLAEDAFSGVTAAVYFNINNTTWTMDLRQNYGGQMTWISTEDCVHTTKLFYVSSATCDTDGYTGDTICTKCGFVSEQGEVIPATGHRWLRPSFQWNEDHSACTATYTCYTDSSHVQTIDCTITTETTDPDCTSTGKIVYLAKAELDDTLYYTSYTETIPALGHIWGAPTFTWDTTSKDGVTVDTCRAVQYCTRNSSAHVSHYTCDVTTEVIRAATCTETGLSISTATFTGKDGVTYTDQKTTEYVQLPHSWSEYVTVEAPTCCQPGLKTRTCTVCGETETTKDYNFAECTWVKIPAQAPTCTAYGWTEGVQCSVCKNYQVKPDTISPLGHDWTDWTVVKEATPTSDGMDQRYCPQCDSVEWRTTTFTGVVEQPTDPDNPFTDVSNGKYYYDAVLWAVSNGITTGATDTTFAPDQMCTRAQVVTFLWRSAGEPEPESDNNPFVDVKQSDYFYKAVLWAVEKGITKGMDDTHFGSKVECSRGHVVTFLWRFQGEPEPSGGVSFPDVTADKFYAKAVAWAVEAGVTNGMGDGLFQPNTSCTRGQIVTFLYRAIA